MDLLPLRISLELLPASPPYFRTFPSIHLTFVFTFVSVALGYVCLRQELRLGGE